jgi:hypothetical protein
LLLAAAQHAALALGHFLQDGEEGKDAIHFAVELFALGNGADAEILPDGKLREYVAALRDVAEPSVRTGFGLKADKFGIAKFDRTGIGADEPSDGLERGGFADAIAAHEAGDFARLNDEAHVAEDTRAIVADVDVGETEHD